MICAVAQLYREEGWYLERIYKWMDRVGLDSRSSSAWSTTSEERARPLRPLHRVAAQRSQDDPWAERAGRPPTATEFQRLARAAAASSPE